MLCPGQSIGEFQERPGLFPTFRRIWRHLAAVRLRGKPAYAYSGDFLYLIDGKAQGALQPARLAAGRQGGEVDKGLLLDGQPLIPDIPACLSA